MRQYKNRIKKNKCLKTNKISRRGCLKLTCFIAIISLLLYNTNDVQKKGVNDLAITTTKDNIFKKIFEDKELFLMFLKDFVKRDWVKNIQIEDLQIMPSKFIGLREGTRESDIVYKISHKDLKMYIFILLEHQGKVNFLMPFRVLEYMTRIWRSCIKDAGKKKSSTKEFLLPPIVPIVFYDGKDNWTAETEFQKKIKEVEIFKKNIPKFEYELISLNKISIEKLEQLENAMSLILIIDKFKEPKDFEKLKALKTEFWEKIKEALKNENILEVVAECIENMMERLNVPEEEITNIINMLQEGKVNEMLNFAVSYDVQKVRFESRSEGKKEEKLEMAKKMMFKGKPIEEIMEFTELSEEEIKKLKKQICQ